MSNLVLVVLSLRPAARMEESGRLREWLCARYESSPWCRGDAEAVGSMGPRGKLTNENGYFPGPGF